MRKGLVATGLVLLTILMATQTNDGQGAADYLFAALVVITVLYLGKLSFVRGE